MRWSNFHSIKIDACESRSPRAIWFRVPHVGFDEFNLCQIFEHLLIASLGGNG